MSAANLKTTDNSARAALAQVAKIAADRGWTSVTEFTAAVPADNARDVAILTADEVDAGPLADWVRQSGTVASVAPLAGLAAEAGPVLAPNRVLVALRCGLLLTADDVTVATSVMVRPGDTYRIVLTGAEDITDAEDLALVERSVWRTLLEPEGEAWQGQDIAARGGLLWTDQDVADVLLARVAADDAALRDWLAGPVAVPAELDRARTDYAATLALEVLETPGPPDADSANAAVRALRQADLAAEVRGLHERLLSRLDADAATTERQVLASLQTLEQDLQSPQAGLSAAYAEHSIRQWAAQTDLVIAQQAASTRDDARHLLGRTDWELVNQAASRDDANQYPEVILDVLGPRDTRLPAGVLPAAPTSPAGPGATGGDLLGALRSVNGGVLITAGVGAVALGLFGLPLLPVAGAAALGIIGGSAWEARHRAEQERQRARQAAGAGAGGSVAGTTAAITAALRAQAGPLRAAVDRRFTEIERALDEAVPADSYAPGLEPASGPNDDESVRTWLRTLITHN